MLKLNIVSIKGGVFQVYLSTNLSYLCDGVAFVCSIFNFKHYLYEIRYVICVYLHVDDDSFCTYKIVHRNICSPNQQKNVHLI